MPNYEELGEETGTAPTEPLIPAADKTKPKEVVKPRPSITKANLRSAFIKAAAERKKQQEEEEKAKENAAPTNGDIELRPLNGDAPNDTNNNQDAQARFRTAGMKARLARRMEKIVEERMTVKQIFNRYVQNSTLHGFRFIFMDTFLIRRALWTVLTIIMAALFFRELKNSIKLFFEYPFTTTSTIQYESNLTFPAISLCSLNHFQLSKINGSKLMPLYDADRLPFNKNWTDPGFDISGDELQDIMTSSSQNVHSLFKSCEWKSRDTAKSGTPNPCTAKNFTTYSNLYGQTCFTFNSGKPGHPLLRLNETGLNMAFKLELDLRSADTLKGLEEIGLNVIVHNQKETPVLQAGFVVSPGYQTFVEMRVRQTDNLPPPYATRCGSNPLTYHSEYRQSSCFLEQLGETIKNTCKCKSEFMSDDSLSYCSLRETVTCLMPTIHEFDRKTNSKCPVDCETQQYLTSLSYARFISNITVGETVKGNRTSYINSLKKTMKLKPLRKYIEENILTLQFYYQDMKKERVQQEASYDFYKLIGDVGGQLGLMLGASVLTLVEFVDLFLFTLYHQLLRLSKAKPAT